MPFLDTLIDSLTKSPSDSPILIYFVIEKISVNGAFSETYILLSVLHRFEFSFKRS
jgi:hypothetical protein